MTDRGDAHAYPPRGLGREGAARYIGVGRYRDRHGKDRWRFRRNGVRASLPGQPGDERFDAAYEAALAGKPLVPHHRRNHVPIGVVYAIQGLPETPVKIGFSAAREIAQRLADLQTGNPCVLRVIAQARAYPRHERLAHIVLAQERLIGEWFVWSPRTEAFVLALPDGFDTALAAIKAIP